MTARSQLGPSSALPVSMDGQPLKGMNRRMDIYIDEAGTSTQEKWTVVAAVIINPSVQLKAVEAEIGRAINEVVPEQFRNDFYFHAKDIKNNRNWNSDTAARIINIWVKIVYDFGLPLSINCMPKLEIDKDKTDKKGKIRYKKSEVFRTHIHSFTRVIVDSSRYIELYHPNDMGSVFAEDISENKPNIIEQVRRVVKQGEEADYYSGSMNHIRNGVSWCSKEDSVALQLADACAFSYRVYKNRLPYGDWFMHTLVGSPSFIYQEDLSAWDGPNTFFLIRGRYMK